MPKKRTRQTAPSKQPPSQSPKVAPASEASAKAAPLPAPEDIFARDEQPSLDGDLLEGIGSVSLSQLRVNATIAEQKEYLSRKRAERWYEEHGRLWMAGEGAKTDKGTEDPLLATLPAREQSTAREIAKALPLALETSYFSPLTLDVHRVEAILEKVVDLIVETWENTPDGDYKDCMNVMYGLCVCLHARIGFNNKLAEQPLHEKMVDCFAKKLSTMVMSESTLWLDSP